jgi:hypothetical protein
MAARAARACAMAARAAGVCAVAACTAGSPSAVAVLAPGGVIPAVAGHTVAVVPVPRRAAGDLPAVAARAASPAGPVHAAQAVTAARPA